MKPLKWAGVIGGIMGSASLVHAHCPLCTAAVGAGILGAQFFGLGEGIIGLFVGAFAVSTGLWIAKKIKHSIIPLQTPIIILLSWILTIIPLQGLSTQTLYVPILLGGEPGTLFNQVLFLNKIFIGSILGGIVSLLAWEFHHRLKTHHGKVLFPFQGVALTLLALLVASGILFITWRGG